MLRIPDLSEYQPHADMAGIKKQNGGVAIIRAGYGRYHPDNVFRRLRYDAHAAGYAALGIYHYTVASQDIAAQAEVFCGWVGKLQANEFLVDDREEGYGNQDDDCTAWWQVVDAHFGLAHLPLGKRSWVYSGDYFAGQHGLEPICNSDRNTWIAAYGPDPPASGHILWQSTNGVTGSYITSWAGAGRCDTSYYAYGLADFAKMIRRDTASDTPPYMPSAWSWKTEQHVQHLAHVSNTGTGTSAQRAEWLAWRAYYIELARYAQTHILSDHLHHVLIFLNRAGAS